MSWRVDTSPPAPPVLLTHPANPTMAVTARFAFTAAEARLAFDCRLDGAAYSACASRGR